MGIHGGAWPLHPVQLVLCIRRAILLTETSYYQNVQNLQVQEQALQTKTGVGSTNIESRTEKIRTFVKQ